MNLSIGANAPMAADWFSWILDVLPIVAVLLSIISTYISFRSHQLSRRLQKFEYGVRLQLSHQAVRFYSPSSKDGFSYAVHIGNSGVKPVEIDRVFVDYGSRDDPARRIHHVADGRFHLRSGEERRIEFEISRDDVEKTRERWGTQDCMFFLRVAYRNPRGGISEVVRCLGGYDHGANVFMAQRGDALT